MQLFPKEIKHIISKRLNIMKHFKIKLTILNERLLLYIFPVHYVTYVDNTEEVQAVLFPCLTVFYLMKDYGFWMY
jgi:hypothetical protein